MVDRVVAGGDEAAVLERLRGLHARLDSQSSGALHVLYDQATKAPTGRIDVGRRTQALDGVHLGQVRRLDVVAPVRAEALDPQRLAALRAEGHSDELLRSLGGRLEHGGIREVKAGKVRIDVETPEATRIRSGRRPAAGASRVELRGAWRQVGVSCGGGARIGVAEWGCLVENGGRIVRPRAGTARNRPRPRS